MKVNLSIGRTINLGNYESLRVEVGSEYSHSDCLQKVIDTERQVKR